MDQKNFSMEQAMAFANSPAGLKLIQLLQQRSDPNIQSAMQAAASGNTAQARESLSDLMADPQIKALLKQLGG